MQIIWSPAAELDLGGIFDYILQENPRAAAPVIEKIESSIRHLVKYPEMGRIGRVDGTRELIIPVAPYIAVYRKRPDSVQIIAIIHDSRDWPDILG